ncbi:hypothetical protein D3C81_1598270 [compost metagenome]
MRKRLLLREPGSAKAAGVVAALRPYAMHAGGAASPRPCRAGHIAGVPVAAVRQEAALAEQNLLHFADIRFLQATRLPVPPQRHSGGRTRRLTQQRRR